MQTHTHITRSLLYITITLSLITTASIPITAAPPAQGFTQGVTWKPYVPLKKVTFVNQEQGTLVDDYAYLAAVPTTVFYDKTAKTMYTNPLLFYEDNKPTDTLAERFLNTRQGIDYFMQDWMGYCDGTLDQLTTINVDPSRLNTSWTARNTTVIQGTDPATIASDLALKEWSYADSAVVAVINDTLPTPSTNRTEGTVTGTVTQKDIKTEHFQVPQTHSIDPIYNEFTIPDGYKMIYVRSWYPCFYVTFGHSGFQGLINMSIPAGDRDLQVYCYKNGQWMMAGIVAAWNAQAGMDRDFVNAYVYNSGKWSVALTDAPTKSLSADNNTITTSGFSSVVQKNHNLGVIHFGRYGNLLQILKNMRKVIYQIDVNMYPGTTVTIPDQPPYGCQNANIKLSWTDSSAKLGFSLIGPSGEEILSTRESGVSSTCPEPKEEGVVPLPNGTSTDMHLDRLGECCPGENYSICVYSLTPLSTNCPFTIDYSWQQNMTRAYGDSIDAATNGAVLASLLNAPLLYTSGKSRPRKHHPGAHHPRSPQPLHHRPRPHDDQPGEDSPHQRHHEHLVAD